MENDPRNRRPSSPKGKPKGWLIKKSEAKQLMAEGSWTPDPEHNETVWTAYVSDRGELLLLVPRGRSILYASRQEFMANMAEFRKLPAPTHVLEGLLPQGAGFIEAIPALIDALAKRLKIPREALDNSFDSLTLVEQALVKVRPRQKILEIPNLFAGIIAYTGEVYRQMTGGQWRLNEVHGGIWEPYVHANDGAYLCPFLEPYKDISERRRGGIMLKPLVSVSLPRQTDTTTTST
jgi:hypothetical protein